MNRREFLRSSTILGGLTGLASLGWLGTQNSSLAATTEDYRALVCLFLIGGNDGHNSLIPTDAAYSDYSKSRTSTLALPKESLIALDGQSAGHSFALHPGLAPLASLYNRRRLAWIANAGPLIVPATAQQVIEHSAPIPPYLMSHSDQIAMQQGWGGDIDASGWAGRGLELLPTNLVNKLNAVTMDSHRTLVRGRNSNVSLMNPGNNRNLGRADLADPSNRWTQNLSGMAQSQFTNKYAAEYARTFAASFNDGSLLSKVMLAAKSPQANFGSDSLSEKLRTLASVLPVFKSMGYKRQVFLVCWGSFDTHNSQRGNGAQTQDAQLATMAQAVAAFDQANIASGLDMNVTTLMQSDFGRTLRPASGQGSDHAWGNHWFAFGGPVQGGQVIGKFPSLVLGGADDADPRLGGRMVPSTATEQVGATTLKWLGLNNAQLAQVFPNLKNFPSSDLGFINL